MTATSSLRGSLSQDDVVPVPKTLSDALDQEDPLRALEALRKASERRAEALAQELAVQLSQLSSPSVEFSPTSAIAGSESIYHTLTKIASGGSQASEEIRELEQTKQEVDDHAAAIATALELRNHANQASAALQAQDYLRAAQSIRPWLEFEDRHSHSVSRLQPNRQQPSSDNDDNNDDGAHQEIVDDTSRARAYLGESAMAQLRETHTRLRNHVTQLYRQAVEQGDLATLGQLTPALAMIQLESQAVQMYLQYLRSSMDQSLQQELERVAASNSSSGRHSTAQMSPGVVITTKMARIYNLAVQTLRHHLPLVSHCLWQAAGDVQVVLLVHSQVEDRVLPLLEENRALRQWKTVTPAAAAIASAIAEHATGQAHHASSSALGGVMSYGASAGGAGSGSTAADMDADDCGFSSRIGTLSDVNLCMDETALLLQHSESYVRFVGHGCREINKARVLRGLQPSPDAEFQQTQLHLALAELGGEYATVEHCLLLASMQRSFWMDPATADPRQYYRPLVLGATNASSSASGGAGSASGGGAGRAVMHVSPSALQTSVMDACWYAARKSTQRSFATGHTGTASAMANFCVDALQNVLLEVASQRAEDAVSQLESLLIGSAGSILAGVMQMRSQHHHASGAQVVGATPTKDELLRKQHEASQGISRACAALNDLEVASSHSQQLESVLSDTIATGFPRDHATEQLQLCVRSISGVTDGFRAASNAVMDSLESVLKPRIRSILGESMDGSSAASSSTFIGSSVMKTGERVLSRMNYNLNDEKYNLLQLSEGYMPRLTGALDELLDPIRLALAPRLWDKLLLDVMGTVSKRLEASFRKCEITSLGALALDADVRDLVTFTKERLNSNEFASNVAVTQACPPLGRLVQIAKLVNVDDLDDVLDLISASRRKNNWDLKLDDTKTFLSLRVEFEAKRVNELLRLSEND